MKKEDIAKVCHEVNKAYCEAQGDLSQLTWEDAPSWQVVSAINGVTFILANPDIDASASHENWMKKKLSQGWKYGETKDANQKTHPCLVPYVELPVEQQIKDHIFRSIVLTLAPYLDK
jgi:hypothetical protein